MFLHILKIFELLCVCTLSHSVMSDSATLWTVACQAPLSMGFSRILQTRVLEWVAISFSRGSSPLRDGTLVSCISRQILYHWVNLGSPFELLLGCKGNTLTVGIRITLPEICIRMNPLSLSDSIQLSLYALIFWNPEAQNLISDSFLSLVPHSPLITESSWLSFISLLPSHHL